MIGRKIATTIYEATLDKIIDPGIYETIELDQNSRYADIQFNVKITKPINQKELAIRLYKDLGYVSS